MTRYTLLRTLIGIRLLARGHWEAGRFCLTRRAKIKARRLSQFDRWVIQSTLAILANQLTFSMVSNPSKMPRIKIGDTVPIPSWMRPPARFRL